MELNRTTKVVPYGKGFPIKFTVYIYMLVKGSASAVTKPSLESSEWNLKTIHKLWSLIRSFVNVTFSWRIKKWGTDHFFVSFPSSYNLADADPTLTHMSITKLYQEGLVSTPHYLLIVHWLSMAINNVIGIDWYRLVASFIKVPMK